MLVISFNYHRTYRSLTAYMQLEQSMISYDVSFN